MYQEIIKVSGELSKDPMDIFKDLLHFTINAFTAPGGEQDDYKWKYSPKDSTKFMWLLQVLTQEYSDGIQKHGWVDPWGECYEAMLSKTKASSFAQFFTPPSLCGLMADISIDPDKEQTDRRDCGAFGFRMIVSDPSCGSSRNLLASAAKFINKPKKSLPFFVGEDLDELCVMMSAVNLMAHGLPAEVICHNTLSEPSTCKFGYVINEGLYPLPGGVPTIRRFTDPKRFVILRNR